MLEAAGLHTPACHAFWGQSSDLACPDETARKQSMAQHSEFLMELAEMGVKTYTIHLGNGPEIEKELAWSQIRKSVDDLLPAVEKTKIVLALENGHDSFEELERLTRLVEACRSPYVGMCYDTGHAHCYTPEGWKVVLELMRPHIATCHMHDNFGSFDDHNPPGGRDASVAGACPGTQGVSENAPCRNGVRGTGPALPGKNSVPSGRLPDECFPVRKQENIFVPIHQTIKKEKK